MTYIQCEMINDMSLLAGKETEVAGITDRAMRGKSRVQTGPEKTGSSAERIIAQ